MRTTLTAALALMACAAAVFGITALAGGRGDDDRGKARQAAKPAPGEDAEDGLRPRPQAVEPGVGAPEVTEAQIDEPATAGVPRDPEAHLAVPPRGAQISPGAPTDAEVRAELRQVLGTGGGKAYVLPSGEAVAPAGAPAVVKQMIAAANTIARTPYLWGGGHGRLYDSGYDCSGSLSFAFIHAGLLQRPIAHGWSTMGEAGPGRWVSVYSNAGHVWMTVAGLRYDTSAISIGGSRWTSVPRSTAGFTVRHLPGL
jgi:cell wall-associated NlpC family hydrolase